MLLELGHSIGERISISDLTCSKSIASYPHYRTVSQPGDFGRASLPMPVSFQPTYKSDGKMTTSLIFSKTLSEIVNFACSELKFRDESYVRTELLKGRLSIPLQVFRTTSPFLFRRWQLQLAWSLQEGQMCLGFQFNKLNAKTLQQAPSVLCGWKDSPPFSALEIDGKAAARERFHLCF